MQSNALTLLGLFVWPDAMPGGAAYLLLAVFPLTLFETLPCLAHLTALFFIWIRAIKRFKRKQNRAAKDGWLLSAWVVGGYVGTTTCANLLLLLT